MTSWPRLGWPGRWGRRNPDRLPEGPLRELARSLPDPDLPLGEARLLAIDLETTGLRPHKDHVVSVGYLVLEGLSIDLGSAHQAVVRPEGQVGQSAVVHGLTDEAVAGGEAFDIILPRVLHALTGRVMLAHFASIEQQFLAAACRRRYGASVTVPVIDTFELQRRITTATFRHVREGGLRLPAARAHFGLPRYRAHEAVTDALACAELFLAQAAFLAGDAPAETLRIRELLG